MGSFAIPRDFHNGKFDRLLEATWTYSVVVFWSSPRSESWLTFSRMWPVTRIELGQECSLLASPD